jgi:tetratricopeptide (TPR) repeat protein
MKRKKTTKRGRRATPRPVRPGGGASPTLSVCLIARDEESCIGRCLRSVRGWADEIVVVDTGSSDRTPEIARRYGASVHSRPWRDDFSDARNSAIERARGDWILFLDADEEIDAENRSRITRLLSRGDRVAAYRVSIRNIMPEGRVGGEFVNRYPRLFRRNGARYEGRIHEQIEPAISRRGGVIAESDVQILHHGYNLSLDAENEKVERNIRMLRAEVEADPSDAAAVFHLAESLFLKGELEEAEALYRRAVDLERLPAPLRAVALQNLAHVLLKRGRHGEAIDWADRALSVDRRSLTPHLIVARARFARQEWEETLESLGKYLEGAERSDRTGPFSFRPSPGYALAMRGQALRALGRLEEAREAYRAALDERAPYPEVHEGLGDCCLRLGRFSEAAIHLIERLRRGGVGAGHHLELAVVYRAQGLCREAARCAEKGLELDPENGALRSLLGRLRAEAGEMEPSCAEYRRLLGTGGWASLLAGLEGALAEENERVLEPILRVLSDSNLDAGQYRDALDVLTRSRRWEAAADLCRAAIERVGESPDLLPALGRIALAAGDAEQAVRIYRSLRDREPLDAEFRYGLAQAYLRLRRLDEAREELGEVLVLRPDDERAGALLRKLDGILRASPAP